MQCQWCEADVKDFDEMQAHMLKFHPELTELENFKEDKIARIWGTSVDLCSVVFGTKGGLANKETVLETFKYFLRELMKSEG
jgi:hypothetical protein